MNFQSFNFNPVIMAGIQALGYEEPTPIQAQAIPHILERRDIIGLAQTGTGKTAAFVLPILQILMEGPRNGVRALIISPTRELAEQTSDVFNGLSRKTGLTCAAIYGGVSMFQQNSKLERGVDIIVACPGRLLDHLWKGSIRLSGLEILVIDEADRMLDMGFLPDIKSILSCIMHERQTLLFSATMPDDIRRLTSEFLHEPVNISIGRKLPARTISHVLYPVKEQVKMSLLKEFLKRTDTDSVLVFTRTKHRTERVAMQLRHAGHRVSSLQGDMPQAQRQAALDGFRSGTTKILVATDIAARGIDILSISHVINYDMPGSSDDYIHRIGRTGRIDNSGAALTFVTDEDNRKIRDLEKVLQKQIERKTLEQFDYSIPHGNSPQPLRQGKRSLSPAESHRSPERKGRRRRKSPAPCVPVPSHQ